MRKEHWKDIKDYEELYKVSNFGKVKSLNRTFYSGMNFQIKKIYPERILKSWNSLGYRQIALCKNGIEKRYSVHRLVATAFLPNPLNLPHVNHKKGNRADNRSWMIEWSSVSHNMKHSYDVLKRPISIKHLLKKGKDNVNSIPVKSINIKTGKERIFSSQQGAARVLRLNVSHINSVLKGKRNKTGNYIFKYLEVSN